MDYGKLLLVLEHCLTTNIEVVEDGEIIPGVTVEELQQLIEYIRTKPSI